MVHSIFTDTLKSDLNKKTHTSELTAWQRERAPACSLRDEPLPATIGAEQIACNWWCEGLSIRHIIRNVHVYHHSGVVVTG